MTAVSNKPILARDEAAGLLVLVYVRHDGAVAETLTTTITRHAGSGPSKQGRFFVDLKHRVWSSQ